MKNKKLLVGLVSTSTIAMVAPAIASCATTTPVSPVDPVDPVIDPVQKQIFDIEGDTLKGFNSSASEQTIKDYCKDGVLRLPAVKTIGANAFNAETNKMTPFGTTIVISDTTDTIDAKAFYSVKGVATVTWDSTEAFTSKKKIGDMAFAYCSDLTSIKLPEGLFTSGSSIGSSVFAGCSKLAKLDLSALSASTTFDTTGWTTGCFCGLALTGKVCFSSSITEDADREKLGKNVWTRLAYNGLRSAWQQCIEDDSEWTAQYKYVPTEYFKVSSNILTGAARGWADDDAYNIALIPTDVQTVSDSAKAIFKSKTNINTWDFTSSGLTTLPSESFNSSTLNCKVLLGSSTTEIGEKAFQNFAGTIDIDSYGANVKTIGANAFNGSTLTDWTFNGTMTSVGADAFKSCTSLNSLNFEAYSTAPTGTWADSIFASAGSTNTNTVTFKNVQGTTPSQYKKVDQVKLNDTMSTFVTGKGLSIGTTSGSWTVSPTVTFSTITDLLDINNGTLNGWAKSSSDVELTSTQVGAILASMSITELAIPDTVTTIADNAFYKDSASTIPSQITSITLPSTITSIGANAFKEAAPTTAIDFSGLTALKTIGVSAFENAECIGEVDFATDKKLATISSKAFADSTISAFTFPTSTTWKQIDGDEITYGTDAQGIIDNATHLKDGTEASSDWGYTGLSKVVATDNGRFNDKTWTEVIDACETFEASAQGTAAADNLCYALGFTRSSSASTAKARLEENIVRNANNTGTIIINGKEHTVKCIGAMHDTITGTSTKAALTFELFNVVCDSTGASVDTKWNDGTHFDFTNSTYLANLNGSTTSRTKTWSKTALQLLQEGSPSLYPGLKKVDKYVKTSTDSGVNWTTSSYADTLFPLTCWEAHLIKDDETFKEGELYNYWEQYTYDTSTPASNTYWNKLTLADTPSNATYFIASPDIEDYWQDDKTVYNWQYGTYGALGKTNCDKNGGEACYFAFCI